MTDEKLLQWINALTPPESYFDHELQRLIQFTHDVPEHGIVVEIGVYGGRTASVYLWENVRRGPRHQIQIHLIDSWVLNQSDAKPHFLKLAQSIGVLYHPHWEPSQSAVAYIPDQIDLLHIDGDHRNGAWDDCRNYLPKVKVGGVVVVHDYANPDEYPVVTEAVDDNINRHPEQWVPLGVVGSQFAARRIA